jgi:hypothetical protein
VRVTQNDVGTVNVLRVALNAAHRNQLELVRLLAYAMRYVPDSIDGSDADEHRRNVERARNEIAYHAPSLKDRSMISPIAGAERGRG